MKQRTRAGIGAVFLVGMMAASTSGLLALDGPNPGVDPVDPSTLQQAARLDRFQLTPLPEPPAQCIPGALIRGVDVGATKVIAFSFDDGPWPNNTADVMSDFEVRGLRATFFMIGNNVLTYADIAKSVADRGHEIGNHSVSHQYSPRIIASGIGPANAIIQAATGVLPILFRSPGLNEGAVIQDELQLAGMCNIFTTTDLRDWISPRRSSSQLCNSFRATVHPGEIVLLHDGGSHRQTVDAVPCMLDAALEMGYQIVTVGELLLQGTPYSEGRPFRTQGAGEPVGRIIE